MTAAAVEPRHGPECGCLRCQGFGVANLSAVKSGARSETIVAPLRQEIDAELRDRFGELDDIRRGLLADLLARSMLSRAWLDDQPITRDESGQIVSWPGILSDLADRHDKWARRAWAILTDLERERRERESDPEKALRSHLEEHYS